MRNSHGSFIWYELITSDTDAAAAFYGAVLGWTAAPAGGDTPAYSIFSAGGTAVAGLMEQPDGMKQPLWLGYIGVDDVDVAVSGIEGAGGRVLMPATDIAGVGRLAMLADPQGVPFYVIRGAVSAVSTAFSQDEDGHCAWNELAALDLGGALDFYCGRFGWTKGDAMSMGDMGDYQFIHHDGAMIGAMMTRAPGGPPPMWTFYFRVPGVAAACERAKALGATVLHGPAEIPGGDHILIATDPQGVVFALVGKPG